MTISIAARRLPPPAYPSYTLESSAKPLAGGGGELANVRQSQDCLMGLYYNLIWLVGLSFVESCTDSVLDTRFYRRLVSARGWALVLHAQAETASVFLCRISFFL